MRVDFFCVFMVESRCFWLCLLKLMPRVEGKTSLKIHCERVDGFEKNNSESSMMPSSLSADASEFIPPPCDDSAAGDAAVEQHATLGRSSAGGNSSRGAGALSLAVLPTPRPPRAALARGVLPVQSIV